MLVQEGFYANRTDLIRTAIRNQLAAHADAVRQAVSRRTLVLGIQHYSAADVTPELALATIESLTVLGALQASPQIKAALAGRIR